MKILQQKIQEVRETMAEEKKKPTARKSVQSKPFVLILAGILVAVGMVSSLFFPYSTVTAAAAEGSSVSDSAVTPEFKEFMDSYETFVNGYVDFMKRYANAGADELPSLASEYADWMSQYVDMMKKYNAIDSDSLPAADLAYYLEVVARTTAKLAEISESDGSSTSGTTTAAVASSTSVTTTAAGNSSSSFGSGTNSVSQTADVGICAVVLGAVATAALAMGAVTITRRRK